LFGIVATFASLAFDTNDDVASFFQTSGYLTGSPDGRLMFSHHWIGEALAWLYRTLPGPNWYVWYLYAALLIANILMTQILTQHETRGEGWAIRIGYSVLFFCTALLRPQYTIVAMWLGAAGWFWVFRLLSEDDRQATIEPLRSTPMQWRSLKHIIHLSIGAALLLASALVRWHAWAGISLALVPLLSCYVGRSKRLFWFGFAGFMGLLLFLNDSFVQQQQPLETSMKYQTAIDAVVNGPNQLDSIVISHKQFTINDLKLLQQWFWIDKSVFSPEKIVQLSEGIRQWRTPYQSLRHLATNMYDNWPHVLVWLLVGLGLLQGVPPHKQKQVLLAGLWLLVLLLALAATSRTPFRVIFPFTALLIAALSLVHKPAWGRVHWLFVVLLAIVQAYALYCCHTQNEGYIIDYQKNKTLLKQHPTTLYIIRGDAFPFEGALSWWYNPKDRMHNLLPTGYLIHTPMYNEVLRQWGIDNLAPALPSRPDIQVIDPPTEALEQFYREKYGLEIDLGR
jgi:hypothetical protein